ncbi:NAD(P)-binding protein [Amniculicola lignicola CBS 123094]|uniref:NAD(P)-binding protein n=1 Tax=Amniculicola lignicola CBS 123094 TaxID=1392246 RepID=A0A6A5W4H3_9PLEO|nr:NAD(P)-binding protein [Amniculicola lignicola CBS 123094]
MASRKIVLVTGANSGIGFETVKAFLLSSNPYHVLAGARTLDKANGAIETLQKECPDSTNTVEPLEVDLNSDLSIENAFAAVETKHGHIDALINNAGATFDLEYLKGTTTLRESFTKAYDTNVAGTNVLTHTFIPLLLKSSDPRLIFVAGLANITLASQKYFPTPPLPAGWPKNIDFETIGYRCSKVALNMLMVDWNHKLKEDGVKVWCVGPGLLATNLGGGGPELAKRLGAGHASKGGDILRRVVEGERDGDVGKIVVDGGVSMW